MAFNLNMDLTIIAPVFQTLAYAQLFLELFREILGFSHSAIFSNNYYTK
jgi:hypothetical protein